MDKTAEAIGLANFRHSRQVDKQGKPYILHPLRVMFLALSTPPAGDLTVEEEAQAAVLHDTVEDTGLTLDEVEKRFGPKVRRVLDALSRRKQAKETYRDFIYRIKQDAVAIKLKLADIQDNLGRIEQLPEHERGIQKRYVTANRVLHGEGNWEEVSRRYMYKDGKLARIEYTGPNGEDTALNFTELGY